MSFVTVSLFTLFIVEYILLLCSDSSVFRVLGNRPIFTSATFG